MGNKKYEKIMGWLALVVLVVMLVSILFLPLLQGQNIGEVLGNVLDTQIYHEFKYDSIHDYYSYTNDDTDDSYDDEDDDEYDEYDDDEYDEYDDDEYRQRAEQEYKRIKRDIKHIEKFENSVTFGNEITLLTKYIMYASEVKEIELVNFRYSIVMVILVVVMTIIIILYLLALFIQTLINILRKKVDITKIQKRICRCLFVLVPFYIILNWQQEILINNAYQGLDFYEREGIVISRIGVGCILPFVVLLVFLFSYWILYVRTQLDIRKKAERIVINKLLFFLMMTMVGVSILMNFTGALKNGIREQKTSDIAVGAAFQISWIDFNIETYELEHEDEDKEIKNKKKRNVERLYEDSNEISQKRLIGGILLIIGAILTVQNFCSMNKSVYQNQENRKYLMWTIINLMIYVTAYFILLRANSLAMDLLEENSSKPYWVGSLIVDIGVWVPILLNVGIILIDFWKCHINKILDMKARDLAAQSENQSIEINE